MASLSPSPSAGGQPNRQRVCLFHSPRSSGGQSRRVDLPAKLSGGEAFVHDLRLDGMLHGRVVRPHVRTLSGVGGAKVQHVDDSAVRGMPGLVAIVRNGSFVGVVAEREEQAICAAKALRVTRSASEPLPDQRQLHTLMPQMPQETVGVSRAGDIDAAFGQAAQILDATYTFPWQAHASMGPSCAVADVRPDDATVYSSSQSVFALRASLAPLLGLDIEQVHVIHREGAGCYGHNGADDVSADAALLSQAVGRPVRVQWGRADEFAWEPKGPAMLSHIRAGLSLAGQIVAWEYDVWTPTHTTRPGGEPVRLFAGQLVDPPGAHGALPPCRWRSERDPELTRFPISGSPRTGSRLRHCARGVCEAWAGWPTPPPSRASWMSWRCAAGADPVAFRLRHLTDPRAIEVISRAAEAAQWQARPSGPCAAVRRADRRAIRSGRGDCLRTV